MQRFASLRHVANECISACTTTDFFDPQVITTLQFAQENVLEFIGIAWRRNILYRSLRLVTFRLASCWPTIRICCGLTYQKYITVAVMCILLGTLDFRKVLSCQFGNRGNSEPLDVKLNLGIQLSIYKRSVKVLR